MEQAQETESAGLTKTGSLLGSPLFMSPEQALGSKEVDHRADIWSLGIVLYQALTGRTPFGHIAALGQLIVEISSGRLAPVQDFAPWVPPQVAAIVHGALRRDRNERFQSASDMLAAIRPLLPHGFSLHESMLVSLHVSARAHVQPRLPMSSAPSLPDIQMQALMPDAQPAMQPPTNPSLTGGALVRSHAALEARPLSSKAFIALGAGLLMMVSLGVFGGYLLWRNPPRATATLPQVTPSLPQAAIMAPAALSPAPSPAPPSPAGTAAPGSATSDRTPARSDAAGASSPPRDERAKAATRGTSAPGQKIRVVHLPNPYEEEVEPNPYDDPKVPPSLKKN